MSKQAKQILVFALLLPFGLAAQDLRHPRDLDVPASTFKRPDPIATQIKLPNNLVAYVVEDHNVPLVTISAFIRLGTLDGPPGAAQVLERVFRVSGPEAMPEGGFARALQNMGAEYTVYQSAETTEISLNVAREDAWGGLWMLSSLLKTPSITEADIEALRQRARQAQGMSAAAPYEGSLATAVAKFHAHLYDNHVLSAAIDSSGAASLTLAQVQQLHRNSVTGANMVIAVSGDIDLVEARDAVSKNFAELPAGRPLPRPAVAALKPPATRKIFTYPADKLQAWVVFGHELPAVGPRERAALDVMNYILAGGHFYTRMWIETRDKRGLTNTIAGYPEAHWFAPGSYTFRTYVRPEAIHQLVQIALGEIDRIRTTRVDPEALMIARAALAEGSYAMQFEHGHATASTFAREWLRYGNHEFSATYPARVRAVTAEDVLAAAQKYLHPSRMFMVIVGPVEQVLQAKNPAGAWRLQDFGEIEHGEK